MDDRNAQVGWTDAQWNRVREEVLRAWQSVRVAGSFLPIYGPLPPSTEVVPSERVGDYGVIEDAETLRLLDLSTTIELSRQRVRDESLTDALLLFRRAATALARAEDAMIFRGQEAAEQPGSADPLAMLQHAKKPRQVKLGGKFPQVRVSGGNPTIAGIRAAGSELGEDVRKAAKPGERGLVEGAGARVEVAEATGTSSKGALLVGGIVKAIGQLEQNGYGPPFVCALGNAAFESAHTPTPNSSSLVVPADRIESFLGRQLLRASAIDPGAAAGIVLSLAGDSLDLVVAVEATPEFALVDGEGHYVFRVFERFVLRIKDEDAIVRLHL